MWPIGLLLGAFKMFEPLTYDCPRATTAIVIDGKADEKAWAAASLTSDFIDIEGNAKPKPRFRTRAKMLWDDESFYFFAELEEPHVWGTLTKRNSIIYNDNDFEIFIDPDGDRLNYYEFEINALGTFMELRLDKPYVDGGNYTFIETAVRAAVHIDGTLNDASDTDRKWTVEIAIPFAALREFHKDKASPPNAGDVWRVNFSRVQWLHEIVDGKYRKVPKEVRNEDNWVWSPMGVIDMHRPEKWGKVRFAN